MSDILDTLKIDYLLEGLPNFLGVFPCDYKVKCNSYPCCFILNTDESSEPGEHWVAVFIDRNKQGEYFDPYGIPPIYDCLTKTIERNTVNWRYNKCPIQSRKPNSIACGHHCAMYLALKTNGLTMEHICYIFKKFVKNNDQMSINIVNWFLKNKEF